MNWLKNIWNAGYGLALGAILAVISLVAPIPTWVALIIGGVGVAIFVIEGLKKNLFD